MRVLHLDLETYSSAPLPKCGMYRYCDSPDFEILLLSYAFDDESVVTVDLACGEEIPEGFLAALTDSQVVKIAHNATYSEMNASKTGAVNMYLSIIEGTQGTLAAEDRCSGKFCAHIRIGRRFILRG